MIIRKSRFLKHVELWFDEPEPAESFDVVVRHCSPAPVEGVENEDFFTFLIDLTQSTEQIFAAFDRNTRSKINKADKDGLSFNLITQPTAAQLAEFIEFYNGFAASKNLEPVFEPNMQASFESGMLAFTNISREGQIIVWHALIACGNRVVVTHSASHFREAADPEARNIVGRANRYNHWQEMQAYKAKGFHIYDMGGWYAGDTDQSLLMVNRFKEEFGGKRVHEYNSVCDRSLRAKAAALVRQKARIA